MILKNAQAANERECNVSSCDRLRLMPVGSVSMGHASGGFIRVHSRSFAFIRG